MKTETEKVITEKDENYFQAIGVIPGKVTFDVENNKANVNVQGKDYSLRYAPTKQGGKAWEALKREVQKSNSSQLRLTVYPHLIHFPGKDKQHILSFQLVGFSAKPDYVHPAGLKDFEFKMMGLWQFIPVCRIPCISVFRNFSEQRLVFIKKWEAPKKVRFIKAQHIPLLWKDSPVLPFRFNPRLQKEEQGRRYFVMIKTRFLPGKDAFGFDSLLRVPTQEIPPFFKAGKQMKAEALKIRNQAIT